MKRVVVSFILGLVLCSCSFAQVIPAATGGTMEFEGLKLEFPAGALSGDENITITKKIGLGINLIKELSDYPFFASLAYDIEPKGMTFNEPVKLSIEMTEDTGAFYITYLVVQNDSGNWEKVKGVEPIFGAMKGDILTFEIESLASYALVKINETGVVLRQFHSVGEYECTNNRNWVFREPESNANPKNVIESLSFDYAQLSLEKDLTYLMVGYEGEDLSRIKTFSVGGKWRIHEIRNPMAPTDRFIHFFYGEGENDYHSYYLSIDRYLEKLFIGGNGIFIKTSEIPYDESFFIHK